MKKVYINSDGDFWNGNYIELNGMMIFNPNEEQLTEAGYTEYIEPEPEEPTEEEKLEEAKRNKLQEIEYYDSSDSVNSFTIGGVEMWLTVNERQQIATQISANEAVNRDTMTRWFNGNEYTFPLSTWKQMLIALEVYAGDALNTTEKHKAAVQALESIEEVENYDYTQDYPQKLIF